MKFRYRILALLLTLTSVQALEIQIDYTYDTNNFFDTDEKRAAMEAVADFFGDMIQDTMLEIDPADFTSATWTPTITQPTSGVSGFALTTDMVIPEDTIIVYVGSRDLSGSTVGQAGPGGFGAGGFDDWFARILGRGSANADSEIASENTDFALWGGSIAFDTLDEGSPRTWNFSQSTNAAGTEFIRVALHEMGHVLGMGTADSWDNLINTTATPFFEGINATRSNGGTAPEADLSHFTGSLNSGLFGSFSVTHGTSRPALMLPGSTDTGSNFDVATDIDLAAMVDIGWELEPDLNFAASSLSPSGVTLHWNTVSFKQYAVDRSTELPAFSTVRTAADGDGTTDSYTDPSPPADKAFYRVTTSDIEIVEAAQSTSTETKGRSLSPKTSGASGLQTASQDPVIVDCPATH